MMPQSRTTSRGATSRSNDPRALSLRSVYDTTTGWANVHSRSQAGLTAKVHAPSPADALAQLVLAPSTSAVPAQPALLRFCACLLQCRPSSPAI